MRVFRFNVIAVATVIFSATPVMPITLTGNYDTSGRAFAVALSGNYAYVADFNDGLDIIDISDPSSPTLTGDIDSFHASPWTIDVAVSGNYAYLGDGKAGLVIIDVSDPSSPTETGSIGGMSDPYRLAVSGNYAYVAGRTGLNIVDISDPSSPTVRLVHTTVGNRALDVAVSGNYAYVARATHGLFIVDISNPLIPSDAGDLDTGDRAYGVAVSGNYAYLADNNDGLDIITAAWFGSSTTVTSSTKPLQADRFSDGFTTTKTAVGVPYGSGYIPIFLALGYGLYTLRFRQPS